MVTEAWATLPVGPRALYVELKRRYNGANNGDILLSHRDAAVSLHVHRNTVGPWFKVLEGRGFIYMTRAPHLGPSSIGRASTWALAEARTMDGGKARLTFKKFKIPA
jgi:DNA-binding transcriptional MocR family regulator